MWYRFLFFFLLSVNVHFFFGQSWLSTNGKAIVNANGDTVILKAMNLGGWMLIEPYQIQAAGFASAQWEFGKGRTANWNSSKRLILEQLVYQSCKKGY